MAQSRRGAGLFGSGQQLASLRQVQIQPAPVAHVPFVQPQRREAGGNLTRLAQSLSQLSSGLNNLANVNAQEKADPNSRANQQWIAKRQQMSLDELKREVENNTADGIKVRLDALDSLMANSAASTFKSDFNEFYQTQFDKTTGDLDSAFEQYRQKYADTLPSEIGRGAFYHLTEGYKGKIQAADQEEKISYTKHQLGSALTDSFRNTIEDAISVHGKSPEEAASLVFGNAATMADFMSMAPQERDSALFELAKEYAIQGQEGLVRALLESNRGALGKSLMKDYGVKALTLIQQAGGIRRQEKQDKDWRVIADFKTHVKQGTLDEDLATFYAQSGSLSASAIGEGLAQSTANREAALVASQKAQEKQLAFDNHQQARTEVLGLTYAALEEVGGIAKLEDAVIPNKNGTGTVQFTKSARVEEIVQLKEQEWEEMLQKALDEGQDPKTAHQAVQTARINWYGANNIENKRWSAQLHGLAARVTVLDLGKGGGHVDHVKQVVKLYRDLKQQNPAYLATLNVDGTSKELLEAYTHAYEDLGMDEDTALLDAVQSVTRPDNQKRKTLLKSQDMEGIVEHIRKRFGLSDYNNQVIEKMANQLSLRGADLSVIKTKLEQDLSRTTLVHNGHLIFNQRDLPPDFLPLMDDILRERHGTYKEKYGLPDDVKDLYLEPDVTGTQWVVRSKYLGGSIIGREPITAQTLEQQRTISKEKRQTFFADKLKDTRHRTKMLKDPNYHFRHQTAEELSFWRGELEKSESTSWPTQVIQEKIKALEEDLLTLEALDLIEDGHHPDTAEWKRWKKNHGADVSPLEQIYRNKGKGQ